MLANNERALVREGFAVGLDEYFTVDVDLATDLLSESLLESVEFLVLDLLDLARY